MTSPGFAPSGLPINDADKTRAKVLVQEAYVAGVLSKDEFDARIDRIAAATGRLDLDAAVRGLRPAPMPAAPMLPATYAWASTSLEPRRNTGVGAFAHFSVFLGWIFGPLVTYAFAERGSFGRREAAKAFNWQLTSLVIFSLLGFVSGALHLSDAVMPLVSLVWFVLTIVGGVKAAQGIDWNNPVMRFVPFKVIDERRA